MNRARFASAALMGASLIGVQLLAQSAPPPSPPEPPPTAQAPQFRSVLAGRKLEPPIKGQAEVEFTQPVTKRVKDEVVSTLKVKNTSGAPIARLTIDETWYDKGGAVVSGGKGFIQGLLQPQEVQTVVIKTPYNARMNANNYQFTHANGSVKTRKVTSLDEKKEPAAKTAAAKKPAPKKKG